MPLKHLVGSPDGTPAAAVPGSLTVAPRSHRHLFRRRGSRAEPKVHRSHSGRATRPSLSLPCSRTAARPSKGRRAVW